MAITKYPRLAIVVTCLGALGVGTWLMVPSGSAPDRHLPAYHGPLSTPVHRFTEAPEMPWEVMGDNGEYYLPDVYYADAIQTEQVMPLPVMDVGARPYQIDRLIYPTLGNPNLYVNNGHDSLTVVLRIEPEHLLPLEPHPGPALASRSHLARLGFSKSDSRNQFVFRLLPRSRRDRLVAPESVEDAGYSLTPSEILMVDQQGMPVELRQRETLRFVFSPVALAEVPPGLYDLRFELRRDGKAKLYEYQYNAVRVFAEGADGENYKVINFADSQVSVSTKLDAIPGKLSFKAISHNKLYNFVQFLNSSTDQLIRNAAFITFNGDLHNGGSPSTLLPDDVAWTYNREAAAILAMLKELPLPIFLTAGNHDGYVSFGHVPDPIASSIEKKRFGMGENKTLEQVVVEAAGREKWLKFAESIGKSSDTPGGLHVDIQQGAFIRRGQSDKGGLRWQLVPEEHRNLPLYDGTNQWRRTYGPLNASWNFGRTHYININSYDLRQHRRSGWGMYTVNYGGGVSQFQMDWLKRDIKYNDDKMDIVILSHHDPRGGHNGHDYPYYFRQTDYSGMDASASNYVKGEILNPVVCGKLSGWMVSQKFALDCMHDGLQEWMMPDKEFDCLDETLFASGPDMGRCDFERRGSLSFFRDKPRPLYSGYQFLHRLATHKSIRTLILGHTHYNSMEVIAPGEELVPREVVLDYNAEKHYAEIEVNNPMRGESYDRAAAKAPPLAEKLSWVTIDGKRMLKADLVKAGHSFRRDLDGHELAVLRLTSLADLTIQTTLFDGSLTAGFSVFDIQPRRDARSYNEPQINRVWYFQSYGDGFRQLGVADVIRTAPSKISSEDNPLQKLFVIDKGEAPATQR